MISTIFLDMDGVLADFNNAVAALFGTNMDELGPKWKPGDHEIRHALGITDEEMWAAVNKVGESFWSGLKPYSWHKLLWKDCREMATTCILTSPNRNPTCAAGKIIWLNTHLRQGFRDFLIGPPKHLCARPDAVLVDDSDRKCDAFREYGGKAIVFPRLWNSMHEKADDPLTYVIEQLELLRPSSDD